MTRKYWITEEENFIKNNISIMSIDDFSRYFNLEKNKIIDKIHKMGLNSKKSRKIFWTTEEDNLLKEIFEYAPKNYIIEKIPNRSWAAILQRGIKYLNLRRLSQDHISVDYNFFSEWNNINAYVYGFILADGHVHYGNKNYLQFEVALKDIDVLEKIKSSMKYSGKIIQKNTARLQINNKKIVKDLIEKGIPLNQKTYNSNFPSSLPKEFIKDFCRGVIDGDGWSYTSDNIYNLGLCGNFDLINKIKQNFPEDCSNNKIRKDKDSYCWRFNIKGKKALAIAKWLYEDAEIYLDRKYNAYKKYYL